MDFIYYKLNTGKFSMINTIQINIKQIIIEHNRVNYIICENIRYKTKNCNRHCKGLRGPFGPPQSFAMTFQVLGVKTFIIMPLNRPPNQTPNSYTGARMRGARSCTTPAQFPFLQNKMQPKYFLSLVCDQSVK